MRKENALESLKEFAEKNNCSFLVLIGMKELENGGFRRDIGLIPLHHSDLATKLIDAVCIKNRDYLQLEEKCNDIISSANGKLFEQKNLKASRKQILPIVQQVLD